MNKRKWVIAVAVILILTGTAGVAGWKIQKMQKIQREGIYVSDSKEVPFEYTKFEEYVVLEKYLGGESEVTIPDTVENLPVTHIGRKCFERQEQLEKVVLNDNIQYIGVCTFLSCENLREITGGTNVTCIDGSAFRKCQSLKVVELGNQLERVERGAFSRCSSLQKIPYQPDLMYVGGNAFYQTALEELPCGRDASVQAFAFSDTPWLEGQKEDFIVFGGGLVYYCYSLHYLLPTSDFFLQIKRRYSIK